MICEPRDNIIILSNYPTQWPCSSLYFLPTLPSSSSNPKTSTPICIQLKKSNPKHPVPHNVNLNCTSMVIRANIGRDIFVNPYSNCNPMVIWANIVRDILVNPYTIQNCHPWQTNFFIFYFLDKTNLFLNFFLYVFFLTVKT